VIDGPRDSETFGDSTASLIPFLASLPRETGVASRAVINDGQTKTVPGHAALFTGAIERLPNTLVYTFGIPNRFPRLAHATLFERLRKERRLGPESAVLIASKRKLLKLAASGAPGYGDPYCARALCGKWVSFGEGTIDDRTTYERAAREIRAEAATLLVVAFAEPDLEAHGGHWDAYRAAIRQSDAYVDSLWTLAQSLPAWRGATTLIVTADHGRHLDGHKEGYEEHGDDCEGCRRILFAAQGPDFRRGAFVDAPARQVDVAATIAELLGLSSDGMEGRVMTELFAADASAADSSAAESRAPGAAR